MSNHLAIGGVSLTLRALLQDRMVFAAAPTPVNQQPAFTISPPDVQHPAVAGPRLNLFLYHVLEHPCLDNQEIPGTGSLGEYGHPPLSLLLHYLMTTYANPPTDEVLAQQVHGDAMRVLHDVPIVTDAMQLQRTAGNPPVLDTSLRGQFERIRITLNPTSLEELSKIWTALPQASLRLSAAYQVSVIQIESQRPRTSPLPVRTRRVFAFPLRSPQITEVFREPAFPFLEGRQPVAESGDTLRLVGYNLRATPTRVRLATIDANIVSLGDRQIDVTVPAALHAGVHPVQVFHDLQLDTPPALPHAGFRSNAAAFQLIPRIAAPLPAPAGAGQLLTFTLQPAVLDTQTVELVLGDHVVQAAPRLPASAPVNAIDFTLPAGTAAIPPGIHLLRVRVDGAESRLTVDPATGLFNGPVYQVL